MSQRAPNLHRFRANLSYDPFVFREAAMEKHRPKAQIVTQSSRSPLLMAGCGRCRLGIFSRGFNLKCAMQSSGQEQQEVPFFSTRKNHEG